MERCIFFGNLRRLKQNHFFKGYGRIYFGNEFCQRLIPGPEEVKQAVSFAGRRKLRFTLVTPYVTNAGLKKLSDILRTLPGKSFIEVVVNDWGVLDLINREFPRLVPVLGRLLTKQKRSPNLDLLLRRDLVAPGIIPDPSNPSGKYLLLQKKFPPAADFYYQGSNASSVPLLQKFLLSKKIARIELDNLVQGMRLRLPARGMAASVYLPYVYITTTFFCPTAAAFAQKGCLSRRPACRKQCRQYSFELAHPAFAGRLLYLKGNTQFYRNDRCDQRALKKMGINRIVYAPDLPF